MEFRWYIGKYIDGTTNLIDFTDPTKWTDLSGGNWNLNVNSFVHNVLGASCDAIETVNDILTEGSEYFISYDTIDNSGGSIFAIIRGYFGDYSLQEYEVNTKTGYGTKEHFFHFVRTGKKVRFVANDLIELQNLIIYPYVWNTALTEEDTPFMDDNSTIEINRSERILSTSIQNITGVVFHGASYQALIDSITVYGNRIPIKIECRKSRFDAWESYFLGNIYANDITWDLEKQTCTCDIEDAGAGNVILKNLNTDVLVPTTFGWEFSIFYTNYFVQLYDSVDFHNPANGVFDRTYCLINIYKLLNAVLLQISGTRVALTTTTLLDQPGYNGSGSNQMYCGIGTKLLFGFSPLTPGFQVGAKVTLKWILDEYYKLFNTYSFVTTNATEQSTMQCDNMTLLRVASGYTFTGVNKIKILPNELNRKNLHLGFSKINIFDVNGLLDFISNNEDPENIIDLQSLIHGGNCGTQIATPLDNIIRTMVVDGVAGTSDKFDNDLFLCEYEYDGANFKSLKFTGAVSVNLYNGNFQPDIWLTRHIPDLIGTYRAGSDERFNIYVVTNAFSVVGTNTFYRNIEFEYPVNIDTFKGLQANPYATIILQSDELDPFTGAALNTNFQPTEIKYYPNKNKAYFKGFIE